MSGSHAILALWHAAQGPAHGRAARLLSTAGGSGAGEMSLGAATRGLMRLRRTLRGERLEMLCTCPACGAMNEAELPTSVFAEAEVMEAPLCVEEKGWRVVVRPLTLADLDDAAGCPDTVSAARLLRSRAIISVEAPEGMGPDDVPEPVIAAVEAALDAADPLADPRIGLTCAECGGAWQAGFAPEAFLVAELSATARRLMVEVASLARAYGWSERDILDMPPERRSVYLDLVP